MNDEWRGCRVRNSEGGRRKVGKSEQVERSAWVKTKEVSAEGRPADLWIAEGRFGGEAQSSSRDECGFVKTLRENLYIFSNEPGRIFLVMFLGWLSCVADQPPRIPPYSKPQCMAALVTGSSHLASSNNFSWNMLVGRKCRLRQFRFTLKGD